MTDPEHQKLHAAVAQSSRVDQLTFGARAESAGLWAQPRRLGYDPRTLQQHKDEQRGTPKGER